MIALLAVFITERYRLVAVPGLLIFAALGLSVLWQSFVTRELQTSAAYFALLITTVGPKLMQQEGETNLLKAFFGVSIGFALFGTFFSAIIAQSKLAIGAKAPSIMVPSGRA